MTDAPNTTSAGHCELWERIARAWDPDVWSCYDQADGTDPKWYNFLECQMTRGARVVDALKLIDDLPALLAEPAEAICNPSPRPVPADPLWGSW